MREIFLLIACYLLMGIVFAEGTNPTISYTKNGEKKYIKHPKVVTVLIWPAVGIGCLFFAEKVEA